jgi:2,4-dienoyl-CoA reductase-like NADH-dependent reductase (Old Yellow Enzyme family)
MTDKEILLSPIKIGARHCANRFMASAMEGGDADGGGNPTELTYDRYEKLFEGDWGLISLEAISVSRESRARDWQLSIMPDNGPALSKLVEHMRQVNPRPLFIFQLTHSGELSDPRFSRCVTVKPLPGFTGELLTEEEVDGIADQFVEAAKIAHASGADGIDIKLCGGYLGTQILRPYNDRDWKYGGSWENRSRFAFDVLERIQHEIGDSNFVVGSKIAVWEGFPGGFGTEGPDSPVMDLTEPLALVKGMEERGAAFFCEHAGSPAINVNLATTGKSAPYFAYLHSFFAKELKRNLRPETIVVGSNYAVYRDGRNGLGAVSPEDSSVFAVGARNIEQGVNDMIALGRQSFADPLLPSKLRDGREKEIDYCTLCDNCSELLIQQSPIGCATYNEHYREVLKKTRADKGRLRQ